MKSWRRGGRLITALGVGGVAISLGLKDTIANIIGGFGLMLGRVIQPGDLVTIQGVTGTVHDITWRQTVVRTRSGDMMVIPNSVLNTAALTKLTPASEGMATLEFTAKASGDPSAISQDILDRVTKATADVALEGQPPLVKFTGFSPYGMTGQVLVFAREGVLPSTIKDMAARAIAGSGTEYLVEDGGSLGLCIAGIVLLITKRKSWEFYLAPEELPAGLKIRTAYANPGVIAYLLLTVMLTGWMLFA